MYDEERGAPGLLGEVGGVPVQHRVHEEDAMRNQVTEIAKCVTAKCVTEIAKSVTGGGAHRDFLEK